MEPKPTSYAAPTRQLVIEDLKDMPAQWILRQCLSLDTITITASSYLKSFQSVEYCYDVLGAILLNQPTGCELVEIGEGLQGAVFEELGRLGAVKKEKPGNEHRPSCLSREYQAHSAVQITFDRYGSVFGPEPRVLVPALSKFCPSPNLALSHMEFPYPHRYPGHMMFMDRILPLTKAVRRALITEFFPQPDGKPPSTSTVERILDRLPNKHALARTYFGKQSHIFNESESDFSLRNFPLCLEAMERIGMDTRTMARMMGKAFAIMHWGAGIDGDDVEFVLGTYTVKGEEPDSALTNGNIQYRALGYYVLDFGQCSFVDLAGEVQDIYQAFKGAMVTGDNLYFIPNCMRSPNLFRDFKGAYIEAGQKILDEKGLQDKFDMQYFMTAYEEYAEDFLN